MFMKSEFYLRGS